MRKLRPSNRDTLLNSIGAMFQFQGGISDQDKEKILAALVKHRHIVMGDKRSVTYPEPA